jgi:hypothetical protein
MTPSSRFVSTWDIFCNLVIDRTIRRAEALLELSLFNCLEQMTWWKVAEFDQQKLLVVDLLDRDGVALNE